MHARLFMNLLPSIPILLSAEDSEGASGGSDPCPTMFDVCAGSQCSKLTLELASLQVVAEPSCCKIVNIVGLGGDVAGDGGGGDACGGEFISCITSLSCFL
jgi:hypothetical protein